MDRIISIPLRDILYDVENFSFVEGDMMPDQTAADAHAAHLVFDIARDGNQDLSRRSLRLAHLEVVDALYPYAARPVEEDPPLEPPGCVEFTLRLPPGSADHTPELVRELARQYIAARMLRDWMLVVKPDAASRWQLRIDELSQQLRAAVSSRLRPVRRRLSPF